VVTQQSHPTALGDNGSALHRDLSVGWALGQWRWLVPVTVAAATFAWVLGVVSGRTHGEQRIAVILAGAVLTAVAAGTPLWQQRRASEARADARAAALAARAAMRLALEDALDPFVHLVGRLAEAKGADKVRLRGEAIQLAVTTIAALAGAERIRVCFFILDPGPPRLLRPERFAGRAGAPTVALAEGTAAGDAALRMISRGSWMLVEDTALERPRFRWDSEPTYRTLLAGPVATPDTLVGLLTLDALGPGELSQVDLILVRLLADLLAAALCL
jgi:hypothetical protein